MRTKTQDGGGGWASGREIRVCLQRSQSVLLVFADETHREKERGEQEEGQNVPVERSLEDGGRREGRRGSSRRMGQRTGGFVSLSEGQESGERHRALQPEADMEHG